MNAKIIADLVILGASCALLLHCAISCKFSFQKTYYCTAKTTTAYPDIVQSD